MFLKFNNVKKFLSKTLRKEHRLHKYYFVALVNKTNLEIKDCKNL